MAIVLMVIGVLIILLWFFLRPGRYTEAQKAMVYGVNHAHRGLHSRDKAEMCIRDRGWPTWLKNSLTDILYRFEIKT